MSGNQDSPRARARTVLVVYPAFIVTLNNSLRPMSGISDADAWEIIAAREVFSKGEDFSHVRTLHAIAAQC